LGRCCGNYEALSVPEDAVRRLVAAMNTGSLDEAYDLFAPDYVDHDPLPGQPPGLDGVRPGLELLARPHVGARFHLEDCFAAKDRVAYRLFGTWQPPVEFIYEDKLNLRPTLCLAGVGIYRCREGRFLERWGVWDLHEIASGRRSRTGVADEG
jgi:hypothetical protein